MRTRIVAGGVSLIAATVLFGAVFSYLAANFDYPDILDHTAAEVLPRLLALGTTGRAVWIVYGLVPLLLIPTAIGVRAAARTTAPGLGRSAIWLAVITAASMMIGLLRWPTLHWGLAQDLVTAPPQAQEAIAQRFATANLYLGNVIGEFIGELFLNAFFVVSAFAISAGRPRRTWLVFAGLAAGALGWIAMLRNVTPLVGSIAEVNNIVLPLWMLLLGVVLVTTTSLE